MILELFWMILATLRIATNSDLAQLESNGDASYTPAICRADLDFSEL